MNDSYIKCLFVSNLCLMLDMVNFQWRVLELQFESNMKSEESIMLLFYIPTQKIRVANVATLICYIGLYAVIQ